ncbi:uncharacterized protein LOC124264164 [Haliotis rubra]|uniref:uncharacterized protein LOC124264164 n=1 Tax=Haliotis rubra TaxID=36100 RepID=UPI001EE60D97|nr:uncharacterized protein LOC124264164 [Haliotis rubra]
MLFDENFGTFELEYSMITLESSPVPLVTKNIKDFKAYIETKKSVTTVQKTNSLVSKFNHFLLENNVKQDMLTLPPPELDVLIGSYILSLEKDNGEPYEPDTLTSYHRAIDRHLPDNDDPSNIVQDVEFRTSRKVLEAIRKELKQTVL